MSSEILTLVGVILLLILASAFFSSAETALTAASDARMRQLAGKGNKRARLVAVSYTHLRAHETN